MKTIIRNVKAIVTPIDEVDYNDLPASISSAENKDLVIDGKLISQIVGSKPSHFDSGDYRVIDAQDSLLVPGFIDSHTHIMYCGKRTQEFYMRMAGKTYSEILQMGGGILNTVASTRACTSQTLVETTMKRLESAVRTGTTTIEIKTGYGLDLQSEVKMMRAISEIKKRELQRIISTALPLHAIPSGMNEDEYFDKTMQEILPVLMDDADFVDIFCDEGVFSAGSAEQLAILLKSKNKQFRMHSGEIANIGCTRLASRYNIKSMDHLLHTDEKDLQAMKDGGTIATLLPITAFSLGEDIPDIDGFRRAGIPMSIATDSSPLTMCQNMLYAMYLASRVYHLSPDEVFVGSTLNPARSLMIENKAGTLREGKSADVAFLSVDSYEDIPYMWSTDPVVKVMYEGRMTYQEIDADKSP